MLGPESVNEIADHGSCCINIKQCNTVHDDAIYEICITLFVINLTPLSIKGVTRHYDIISNNDTVFITDSIVHIFGIMIRRSAVSNERMHRTCLSKMEGRIINQYRV